MADEPVRRTGVVVFSDSFVVRAGLARVGSSPPLDLRADVADPTELVATVERTRAEIILASPGPAVAEPAFAALGQLRARDLEVLVFLPNMATYQILASFLHRKHGLISLPLEATVEQLREALRYLVRGQTGEKLAPPLPEAERVLTAREAEILRELAKGSSNRGIADTLVLSMDTVKTHLRHIYRKLGVGSRSEAISVYVGGF